MFSDKMQTTLEEHKETTVRCFNVIIKTVAVARNTASPNPNELQISISNFQSFKAKNGKE